VKIGAAASTGCSAAGPQTDVSAMVDGGNGSWPSRRTCVISWLKRQLVRIPPFVT